MTSAIERERKSATVRARAHGVNRIALAAARESSAVSRLIVMSIANFQPPVHGRYCGGSCSPGKDTI